MLTVLATGGDTHLGGDDIDQKIIKYLVEEFKKEQDKEVNSKRTLTDKPLTKVDVDPKIEN